MVNRLLALDVQPPNILGALEFAGQQQDRRINRERLAADTRLRERELEALEQKTRLQAMLPGLREGAVSGEQSALSRLMALAPGDPAVSLGRDELERRRGIARNLIGGVALASPEEQPALYAQALNSAREQGLSLDGIPEQFDPQSFPVLASQFFEPGELQAARKARADAQIAERKASLPPGAAETTSALQTRQAKIDSIINDPRFGGDVADAEALVDQQVSLTVDPNTGERVLVNERTGRAVSLAVEQLAPGASPFQPAQAASPPPQSQAGPAGQPVRQEDVAQDTEEGATTSVFADLNSGEGASFGLGPVIQEGAARTLGQFGFGVDNQAAGRRSKINRLKQKLIIALSISSRPPVVEQERIERMLPDSGIFESDARARSILADLHKDLMRQIRVDTDVADDRSVTPKERSEARRRVREISGALDLLGDPDEGVPTPQTEAEFNALPQGAIFRDPDSGELLRKR